MLSSSGRIKSDVAAEVGLSGTLTKPVRKSDLYNCLIDGFIIEPDNPDEPEPAIALPSDPVSDANRARVLLVEDNPTNRLVASRMIEKLGYVVEMAENGREAVEAVSAAITGPSPKQYAVIFMDCQMPVMDGYEATKAIRGLEGADRHTPIVAMTAAAMIGDREICIAAGMDDYLAKPIRPDLVRAAITKWAPETMTAPNEPAAATKHIDTDGVIDIGRLELLVQLDRGGGDLLNEVLHQYIEDTTMRLVALHEAMSNQEMTKVAEVAHSTRGASSNVGATMMTSLCARIEELAKKGDVAGCSALTAVVDGEFERVKAALMAALERAAGGQPL
jgi:CheY-like chemotaxis protein/HPt (histidine-containing phosphotransfer) domain-containing protein